VPTHLQSIDSQTEYAALTGLRGLAAFWVFCFHFCALLGLLTADGSAQANVLLTVLGWGGQGVFIFFTLSGFLLSLGFVHAAQQQRAVSIRAYLTRRLFRVFPTYYVQLLLLCIMALLMPGFLTMPSSWQSWLAHLTMSFHLPPAHVNAMLGVWWTLPIEFGFYLLLPLLAPWLKPARIALLLALCLLVMLCYRATVMTTFANQGLPLHLYVFALPGSMDSFGIGAIAAVLCTHYKDLIARNKAALGLTTLVLLVVSFLIFNHFVARYWSGHWVIYVVTPLLALSIAGLCLLGVHGSYWLNACFGNAAMRFLGNISYSVYLWHIVVIMLLMRWIPGAYLKAHPIAYFFLTSAAVIFVSYLSYRFAELPGIRLGRKLSAKDRELR
jgi:peptidoglycan/LPS O-acetylase OafA/YrhL